MNFADLTPEFSSYENSAVVVQSIPYDATSTWGKGADFGPEAIIEASMNMEVYDIETNSEAYKIGIHTLPVANFDNDPAIMTDQVYKNTCDLVDDDKFVVSLGGEHSVSVGAIKAYSERYDDITVVQIDAHADMRDEYHGSPFNHACVMARVKEFADYFQIGIRSVAPEELHNINKKKILYAHQLIDRNAWQEEVVNQLNENVYLTIDLDGFDPSIMPSTGTPEPGGLLWYETLELIRLICEKKNLIGMDVVELAPNKKNKAPDFLAAKLIYKTLSYKYMAKV